MSNIIYSNVPYTYFITFLLTGQRYYGVRYSKNCHPTDLWNTYYTSSKTIHDLIEQYGKTSFEHKIDKIFNDVNSAIIYETHYLKSIDAKNNSNFFNKHNGDGKFSIYGTWTKLHKTNHYNATHKPCPKDRKLKISKAQIGKKIKESTKEKLRIAKLGVPNTPETNLKISCALSAYYCTHPPQKPDSQKSKENYYKLNLSEKCAVGRRESLKWKKSVTSNEYRHKTILSSPKSEIITINNIEYPSIRCASRILNFPYNKLRTLSLSHGKDNIILA